MGIPSDQKDVWASKRSPFMAAASPNEPRGIDSKASPAQEAVQKGFKMALLAGSVAAVPTLVGCRVVPWAKANLNYTAQALIISAAAISAFFITADKTILKTARGNTIGKYDKTS
ncbi:early nodulin-93-like [Phalaenopsis equestris]|uniref:early nodulin-93-like n=1 Tax=Phalaenopsis equestris TaxID=78828 RepID=UPI0009E5BDE4|nr:early nodulin-93-like [Phalaenopsis equestris]